MRKAIAISVIAICACAFVATEPVVKAPERGFLVIVGSGSVGRAILTYFPIFCHNSGPHVVHRSWP